MNEPRTAADLGRRNVERYMAHEYGITTNDAEWMGLLDGWRDAIEAEARAAALDDPLIVAALRYYADTMPGYAAAAGLTKDEYAAVMVDVRKARAAIDALRETP